MSLVGRLPRPIRKIVLRAVWRLIGAERREDIKTGTRARLVEELVEREGWDRERAETVVGPITEMFFAVEYPETFLE